MKFFIFILSAILCIGANAQGIVTVNNNADFPADYDDLQAAIDDVNNGTIILVSGSGDSYGNITVDKQLAIYGPGYFLGDNEEPWTQASTSQADLGTLTFAQGSSGTILAGMYVNSTTTIQETSNVILKNNALGQIVSNASTAASNITIEGNYLYSGSNLIVVNTSGLVFRNNLIVHNSSVYMAYNNSQISGLVIENNTFYLTSTININIFASGATFRDNIIVNNQEIEITFNPAHLPSSVNNNISTEATLLEDLPNNISDANPTELFIDWENPALYSQDYIFTLAADSPAVSYGSNGQDVGCFGGDHSYRLSGISDIPHIFFLDVPNAGSAVDGLEIRVKAKANN